MTDRIIALTYLPEQNTILWMNWSRRICLAYVCSQSAITYCLSEYIKLSPISSKGDLTNFIHLKPCVPLMFIIYNKRAIFDDNLLDDISLFQKLCIRHFISITSGKRPNSPLTKQFGVVVLTLRIFLRNWRWTFSNPIY
jgi:hypothetical protein